MDGVAAMKRVRRVSFTGTFCFSWSEYISQEACTSELNLLHLTVQCQALFGRPIAITPFSTTGDAKQPHRHLRAWYRHTVASERLLEPVTQLSIVRFARARALNRLTHMQCLLEHHRDPGKHVHSRTRPTDIPMIYCKTRMPLRVKE